MADFTNAWNLLLPTLAETDPEVAAVEAAECARTRRSRSSMCAER